MIQTTLFTCCNVYDFRHTCAACELDQQTLMHTLHGAVLTQSHACRQRRMRDAYQQGNLAALWERALALGEQPLELSLVRPRPEPCKPRCLLARPCWAHSHDPDCRSHHRAPLCLPAPWASRPGLQLQHT